MTLVCVPIMVQDVATALDDAVAARDAGADLVEFRVDECFSGSGDDAEMRVIARLVGDCPLPVIVTCRVAAEGGKYDGTDDVRVALYEFLGAGGDGLTPLHRARYLDLELAAYERSANLRQKVHLAIDWPARRRADSPGLILSIHDFNGRPADLTRRIARAGAIEAADVVKVAYRARSIRDNLELLDLVALTGRPTIALGMGEFGLMSRVLAPKFGGFLTFASLRAASATAPGQPTVRELLGRYRFRAIGRDTRVYGVIGWPVGHSLSPVLHNAGFEAVGHDGVYLPMPVQAGEDAEASYLAFKATVLELAGHKGLGFSGASVTLPHKENLVRLAREQGWGLDEASGATGAANTLVLGDSPRVVNTDVGAVVEALGGAMGVVAGRNIAVLGAGGAGRAAAWGLARAGASVRVFNRSADRAARVAEELSASVGGAGEITAAGANAIGAWRVDACVNCTPVGMNGGPDPAGLPIDAGVLKGWGTATVVMDTVYNPVMTPLLRGAAGAGCRVVTGVEMFVRQAAMQFEAWTGRAAPAGLFRRICDESLAGGGGGA